MSDAIRLSEDSVEVPCGGCGEPLILEVGDCVDVVSMISTGLATVVCSRCAKLLETPTDLN